MKPDAAHRFIEQLCACCNWAVESGFLERNAFIGLGKKIKVPDSQQKSEDDDIDPFSWEERDRIIEAFRGNCYYRYYADLVEFLFKVGYRPSEALALQWKHIGRLLYISDSIEKRKTIHSTLIVNG
jgi:integrase